MQIDLNTLGQNIREYRTDAGMTQSDLAFLIGSRQQNVGRWETGEAEPTLTTLYLIAGALGMNDTKDLLRGVELQDGEQE